MFVVVKHVSLYDTFMLHDSDTVCELLAITSTLDD